MSKQIDTRVVEDVSSAFELLQDARRRGVLYTVKRNGETSVEEVAHRIAAWESADDQRATEPKAVETSLVHSHLPKLDAAGVIDYDSKRGSVELAADATGLEPFLQCTREREPTLFHAARTSNLDRVKEVTQ
ncbi:hypothetical protein BRD15_04745 [Halobacteriales archaeon SW_6_65_15]|jgi:hypothetical protein|nr:MAG: hypothetical protein BRD15_04745 [Halobacteriales archaeon SW_6_65_15]